MTPRSEATQVDGRALEPDSTHAEDVVISGVVQGVGFRPFIYRMARKSGLRGTVRNEHGAVRVVAEGTRASLDAFEGSILSEAPALARIDRITRTERAPQGLVDFHVAPSDDHPTGRLPVPPDVATCAVCLDELEDPSNRRFGYPFTTCTDCGPRFTLMRSMPYDRDRTSMAGFTQCEACRAEYTDPTDRRYHAQTNACPRCGPRLSLEIEGRPVMEGDDLIRLAVALLGVGRILAVRGVGGFHLAVDARSNVAVERLRRRKGRDDKPFAVMVSSVEEARKVACVSTAAEALLRSYRRPIVLLPLRDDAGLAEGVCPGLGRVGLMLAYSPLHHLLLREMGRPLVMTSGNLSEQPIVTDSAEARRCMGEVADGLLLHDRDIVSACDDSVVRPVADRFVILRRARGYAPLPVRLPIGSDVAVLAVGSHLKNTFTLAEGTEAWISPHIGDLDNIESVHRFHDTVDRYLSLFNLTPEAVVRDLHPGYLSTRLAAESGLPELPPVQHHHAHVAAVAAEHGIVDIVLGLAFDGTGYGDDGKSWGCEFLLSDLRDFRRLGHLRYAPMPGGDLAARSPWRALLGYASLEPSRTDLTAALESVPTAERDAAGRQVARGVNAPPCSSLGRLFDAAAAALGIRARSSYEGQAAMELEDCAGRAEGASLPRMPVDVVDGLRILDPVPLLAGLARGRAECVPLSQLAAGFHDAVAAAAVELTVDLSAEHDVRTVALGGGCFQNARLLESVRSGLEGNGLTVLVPRLLPPNDGGVSYGQAAVAAARLTT